MALQYPERFRSASWEFNFGLLPRQPGKLGWNAFSASSRNEVVDDEQGLRIVRTVTLTLKDESNVIDFEAGRGFAQETYWAFNEENAVWTFNQEQQQWEGETTGEERKSITLHHVSQAEGQIILAKRQASIAQRREEMKTECLGNRHAKAKALRKSKRAKRKKRRRQ